MTQAAARRCKHIQMHKGGAPRSSWPPVTCATTRDAALEALLQARRTPSRASRNSLRVPSASGGARPARDSSCSAAARETSRRAAPCDPGRPMRFARVGAPQRRPVAPSQRGRARLTLGSLEAGRPYPTPVEIHLWLVYRARQNPTPESARPRVASSCPWPRHCHRPQPRSLAAVAPRRLRRHRRHRPPPRFSPRPLDLATASVLPHIRRTSPGYHCRRPSQPPS